MTSDFATETPTHPVLLDLGFSEATPIQKEAIPVLAAGESVLALAPTGSGKTLSFLIPLMQRLDATQSDTQLLILAPTRELGNQISQVAQNVSKQLGSIESKTLQVRTVFGGQKADTQKLEIAKNPAVVVATPGRALELIEQDVLKVSQLKAIVLDEADVMVGMGFEAQVKAICDHLPTRIQAALFSATESEGQSRLQNRLVHRGKRIDVRTATSAHVTVSSEAEVPSVLHQTWLMAPGQERVSALGELLAQIAEQVQSGIVFCQTRESVQTVVESLQAQGHSVAGLSGELGQIERATIMRRFKAGGVKFLVATNIASRGIDVCDLSVVINYELPSTQQEYLHRAGRSGRAGKSGWTISLCTAQSRRFLSDILTGTELSLASFQKASEPQIIAHQNTAQQFSKIHVNRGKSSKLRPGDFLGALTKDLGLAREDVGGIFIFDHFTHVEINIEKANGVIRHLSGRKIKNVLVKATGANTLSAPRGRGF